MTVAVGPIQVSDAAPTAVANSASLGEEAVAGVHGVAPRRQRCADNLIDVEVGVGGRRSGEGDRTVGELHRHRVGVGVAVHHDGLDSESVARPDHADGDLAAIGDEYAGDHLSPPSRPGKLAHVRQLWNHPFTELAHRRSTIRSKRRSERHVTRSGFDELVAALDDVVGSAAHAQLHHRRRNQCGAPCRVRRCAVRPVPPRRRRRERAHQARTRRRSRRASRPSAGEPARRRRRPTPRCMRRRRRRQAAVPIGRVRRRCASSCR